MSTNVTKGGRLRRRVGVLLVTTLLGVVLAEIAVRSFWPLPLSAVSRDRVRLSEDPEWLYELDPEHPEHNTLGLRGPEVEPQSPSGLQRVLVLGDSIAYGLGVEPRESLSSRLQEGLQECEVLNAGVPGWSILQEAAWYESRGAQLEPDLVLLVVCLNDWTAYTVEFDQLVAAGEAGGRSFFSSFYDPESSSLRRLLLRSHVVRRLQMALAQKGWAGSDEWEQETTREGVPLVETTSVKQYWKDREFFGQSFARLVGALEAPLVVLLVPVGREGYAKAHASRRAELEALCSEHQATFLDFADLAAQDAAADTPWWQGLYHADDALHPDANGYRRMAAGLMDPLTELLAR